MSRAFLEVKDFLHFVCGGTFLGLVLLAPVLLFRSVRAMIASYWRRDPVRCVADLWVGLFSLGIASFLLAFLIVLHFHL